ncbi:nuclear pore complex protein Nup85 isoform X2 [Nematostella vectensis]|uniref:nuclear pore complex protein Nup85 isoform X2 n=1 Tax=Nematostella vectensis TaxID=45351 RepID=UPI0020779567|nr:nuclear pore complex protein Nup85 isoform X2 [Nematostella vectensis]
MRPVVSDTCQLINETHGIFLDLQQLHETGVTLKKASLIKISRRYRAVLRSCLLQLRDTASRERHSEEGRSSVQKQTLTMIELVWHLCEFLFIESVPGGTVLTRLLEWSKTERTERYLHDVLQYHPPSESPSYWPAVYSLVLQGQMKEACELLSQHPEKVHGSFDVFEQIIDLMRTMPSYQMFMGSTASDFVSKWNHWHLEVKAQLEAETYAGHQELQLLCQVMAGDDSAFRQLKEFCPTWYQMLASKLLYCNPAVKLYDLQYHTQPCVEMFGGNVALGHFDRILLSAFEFDIYAVIKGSSESFGNWWFVSHLTDLLHHCGQLDSNQISCSVSLREFLLLEYSASLMSHHSLWQVAVDYLKHCPQYGRAHLEEYIEHLPLETDKKATKVLRVCKHLDLPYQAQSICKTMSMRALKMDRLGSALSWCLRSKDSAFAAFISERFLEEYCKNGDFTNLDLIDHLGSDMLLNERLTFLGKYREFHRMYAEADFRGAATLLVSLLTSRLSPKSFWLTLLTDALPLLESNEIIFTSNQTYELMHCLEEIRLSFRSADYLKQGHAQKEKKSKTKGKGASKTKVQEDEEEDKISLLRLALARNLARSILKEGQCVA